MGPPKRSCWICSRALYTLFFAKVDKKQAGNVSLQILPEKVRSANHCVVGLTEHLQFNMETIREFSERIDRTYAVKFNYLRIFKAEGKIDTYARRAKEMNKVMRAKYERLVEEYKETYYNT